MRSTINEQRLEDLMTINGESDINMLYIHELQYQMF